MTEIEQKAFALLNEVLKERESDQLYASISRASNATAEALCRAIEKHEADKAAHAATVEGILKAHEAYKQEVSEFALGAKEYMLCVNALGWQQECDRFILVNPDVALAEAMSEAYLRDAVSWDAAATHLRKALARRGFKIVETGK